MVADSTSSGRFIEKLPEQVSGFLVTITVHPVPAELDSQVAQIKLAAMELSIDTLSAEQQRYLTSWREGT